MIIINFNTILFNLTFNSFIIFKIFIKQYKILCFNLNNIMIAKMCKINKT
jgi:hypothetical protein